MRRIVLLTAIVIGTAYCGQPKPSVLEKWQETAMEIYHDIQKVWEDGVDWTIETIGNTGDWTTTRIKDCIAGKGHCDLRLPEDGDDGEDGLSGADGADGVDGIDGAAGRDGVDGSDGVDGLSCSVTRASNGALVRCGDSSAVVFDGEDGSSGVDGRDGGDGVDGQSCSLERRNSRCYGPTLRYKLFITCGQDSEELGRYTQPRSPECR